MEINTLSPILSVGPQISLDDIQELAKRGFTDIVCNRPDAEHPEGPSSASFTEASERSGIAFHYLPIVMGSPYESQAKELAQIASQKGVKIFAYCRSGMRAKNAWEMANSGRF